jgi:hypothetical protein
MIAVIPENSRRFLKKLKVNMLYDPAIQILYMYQSDIWTSMLIATIFTIASLCNQPG